MDAVAAIHGRRTIRAYRPEPVSRALLEEVLWAAVQAPTPPVSGTSAWKLCVIEGVERLAGRGAGQAVRVRASAGRAALGLDREARVPRLLECASRRRLLCQVVESRSPIRLLPGGAEHAHRGARGRSGNLLGGRADPLVDEPGSGRGARSAGGLHGIGGGAGRTRRRRRRASPGRAPKSCTADRQHDGERSPQILDALARGIDPETGEVFPDESPINSTHVVRALHMAVRALEHSAAATPKRVPVPGQELVATLDQEEDERLIAAFDAGATIAALASAHQRRTGGITARLIKLGRLDASPASGGET